MSKHLFVAAITVVLGVSAQAQAFHPCGHYHYHQSLHSSGPGTFGGPAGGAVVQPHGVASFGVSSFGVSSFGVSPFGVSSFGVVPHGVSSFGVVPNGVSSFGVSPFGVVPHGVSSFGVSPFGVVPNGVSSFGAMPNGVSSFGVSPFGAMPNGVSSFGATPSGFLPTDILTILQNACKVANPGGTGGGANADAIAAAVAALLRKDLDSLKSNQALTLEDLRLIRAKLGIEPRPEAPAGKPKHDQDKNSFAPSVSPPTYATVDRNLGEIVAIQQRTAEKESKSAEKESKLDQLRAARKQGGTGTGVASK